MTAKLPIRWRLTLWYGAFLAAALGLFALGTYAGLRQVLNDSFNQQLQGDVALARTAVRFDQDSVSLDPEAVASLSNDERFVRLFGPDGALLIDTSRTIGDVPVDPALIRDALEGQTQTTSVDSAEAVLRVVTMPVRGDSMIAGALQVGRSREDVDDILRTLPLVLAFLTPLALAMAAGGGYLLAGRALAPVSAITQLAERIDEHDLDARLNLSLPDDELGRLARTFDTMLTRMEDAFERQRRFAGDAAHELRTPLSLMRSQVDLALARPRSPEEYREALSGLDRDLERLTALVSTLLTLARADAGRLIVQTERVDLAETIALCLEQYAPLAEEAGISIVNLAEPAVVMADEGLLIQVLVNLLDNALAHTPTGGTVTVGCNKEERWVRLWVEDTGTGIPPEHQARVFDRFYRVDAGRARDAGGTGLGLALCKAIVEAHKGTIQLRSAVGKGTRFDILLPGEQSADIAHS